MGRRGLQGLQGPQGAGFSRAGPAAAALTPIANGGSWDSITIGSDGLGLVAYRDNAGLRVAHCSNPACTTATTSPVDTGAVFSVSIAIGADGNGLIAYQDASDHLKVAHCTNVACTTSAATTIDSAGFTGYGASVTIGCDGLGLISYILDNPITTSGSLIARTSRARLRRRRPWTALPLRAAERRLRPERTVSA